MFENLKVVNLNIDSTSVQLPHEATQYVVCLIPMLSKIQTKNHFFARVATLYSLIVLNVIFSPCAFPSAQHMVESHSIALAFAMENCHLTNQFVKCSMTEKIKITSTR